MRYIKLPQFAADLNRLSDSERATFVAFLREELLPLLADCGEDPSTIVWPARMGFESITGAAGVYALTWSFSGPDGRATFSFEHHDGHTYLVWRRVGRHRIYRNP